MRFGRLIVAPNLIIESVSKGHEDHDRDVKRRWYADARVPNYWILDGYGKSLECLVFDGRSYRVDQSGKKSDVLYPSAFRGLEIPLAKIWL